MDGATGSLAAQAALETLPGAERRLFQIQSDNVSAFMSSDFVRVLKENRVRHIRIPTPARRNRTDSWNETSVRRGDGLKLLAAQRANLPTARQRGKQDNLNLTQRTLALPSPRETPVPYLTANYPVSHFV